MTEEAILQQIRNIGVEYDAEKILLFGSRAKGTAQQRSDFDLAVSGVKEFDRFKEAVESIPTLYSFDIINLDQSGNILLKREITEYGQNLI